MHLIALRRDIYEAHPFIASSLFDAMCAEERARMPDARPRDAAIHAARMTGDFDQLHEVFGGDAWPYGIEPNRPTLEALMTYLTDQGSTRRPCRSRSCSCQATGSPHEAMARCRAMAECGVN